MISAINNDKIIVPFYIEGSCNGKIFEQWVKEILLPSLERKKTIIMDNVAFHKNKDIVDDIEKLGHSVIFLPPYSPDLNPIEKTWSWIKNRIRTIVSISGKILGNAINEAFSTS